MTKSVLFGAVALALTITAASAEDVESANYMMPGYRAFAMEMEYAPAGLCAGRIYGMLFMASVIGGTLQSASPSDASSPLRKPFDGATPSVGPGPSRRRSRAAD